MKSHDWLQVRTIIEGVGWKSCYLSVDIVWIFFSQKCLNFCMWFSINLKTLSYNFLHSVWFALRFQEVLYAKKKKTVFLAASFGDLLLHKKQNIFFVIGSIILSASWCMVQANNVLHRLWVTCTVFSTSIDFTDFTVVIPWFNCRV